MNSYAQSLATRRDYLPDRCRSASVPTTPERTLELDAQQVCDLADDAATEQEHAGDEDDALDHRHPLVQRVQVILHRDDDERTHHRAENGAEPTDQIGRAH